MGKPLTLGGQLKCAHDIPVPMISAKAAKVTIDGNPVILATGAPFSVAGCTNMPPPPSKIPCTAITFAMPSDKTFKVTSMGMPLLLQEAKGMTTCAPPPNMPKIQGKQTKVEAT